MSCFMTAPASGFRMGCGGRESWRGKRRTLQTPTWGFPYEMDANQFAYGQVRLCCGASEALERLLTRSSPEKLMTEEEYQQLFRRIDEKLAT